MNYQILTGHYLQRRCNRVECLGRHSHGIRLRVNDIQMRLVDDEPVIALSQKYEPSCLVKGKPNHRGPRFMACCHLQMAIGLTEGVRFIITEKSNLSGHYVEDSNPDRIWLPTPFLFEPGEVGRIARKDQGGHA